MSVVLQTINGVQEFVHVPGHDVVLSRLAPAVKQQLWRGILVLNPQLSDGMKKINMHSETELLQQHFGVGFILTQAEFNRYMTAGSQNLKQQQRDKENAKSE